MVDLPEPGKPTQAMMAEVAGAAFKAAETNRSPVT